MEEVYKRYAYITHAQQLQSTRNKLKEGSGYEICIQQPPAWHSHLHVSLHPNQFKIYVKPHN